MDHFIETTKALSDPNRVRALMALRERELCVCRIIELLQLAPSTVSKHLTILKQAGLIESRKEGRWMHYRLCSDERAPTRTTLAWIFQRLEGSPEIEADQERMRQIINMDLDKLTQIYNKGA